MTNAADVRHEFGVTLIKLHALQPADAIVLAVADQPYVDGGWSFVQRHLVLDVKARFDRAAKPAVIELWRL